MSIHYNKQSQFELFPETLGPSADAKKNGFFRTTLIVSLDHLVVFGIILMMLVIVAFSLGVERGKFVVRLREEKYQLQTLTRMLSPAPVARQTIVTHQSAGPTRNVIPVTQPAVAKKPLSAIPRTVLRTTPGNLPRPANLPQMAPTPISIPAQNPALAPQPVVPKSANVRRSVVTSQPVITKASLSLPVSAAMTVLPQMLGTTKTATRTMVPQTPVGQPAGVVPVAAKGAIQKKVDNAYTVQVASYANVGEAQRAAADLQRRGMEVVLMPKGKFLILCVGNFSARPEAESASRKLKPQFKDCVIRSL